MHPAIDNTSLLEPAKTEKMNSIDVSDIEISLSENKYWINQLIYSQELLLSYSDTLFRAIESSSSELSQN